MEINRKELEKKVQLNYMKEILKVFDKALSLNDNSRYLEEVLKLWIIDEGKAKDKYNINKINIERMNKRFWLFKVTIKYRQSNNKLVIEI